MRANSQRPRQLGRLGVGMTAAVTSSSPPSSFRPSLSLPFESPLSPVEWMASVLPHDPAHSAAWHVGPGVGDLACAADSRSRDRESNQQIKKMGCSIEHPLKPCGRTTASSRPFSSRPWQLSSPLFSPQDLRLNLQRPRGRHNGWAEPSTLIPDVDYG
jgi:hypothetical protein